MNENLIWDTFLLVPSTLKIIRLYKMDNLEKISRKYFTGPLASKCKEYKGSVLSQGFKKMEDQIYNMEVREDDIWVVTFPRSGTTWVQEMIWMILNDLDFEEGRKTPLDLRSPYLDITSLSLEEIEQKSPELKKNLIPIVKESLAFIQGKTESKSSIIVKTHLPWELLPKEIQEGTKKPKIVYVSRDPKDVCVSYFYHNQQFLGYTGDFETFCELFLEGKLFYTPYWLNVLSFYKQNRSNIMFISYEEMIKDLPSVIRKVAEFLGKPINEKQIEDLAEYLSFENMKKNPAVNYTSSASWLKPFHGEHTDFIRNGKIGDFKNIMSPEMISKFDKWIEKNTEGTEFVSRM